MNKKIVLRVLLAICLIGVFSAYLPTQPTPAEKVYTNYLLQLKTFEASILELQQAINNYKTLKDSSSIITKYLGLRCAFKSAEPLIEYLHPDYCKNYINGAPLPKIEEGIDQLSILQPHGIQVIDELMFASPFEAQIPALKEEITLLRQNIQGIQQNNATKLQDRFVFEASRLALVRVFTLGITGFDTPGSQNAIKDAENVINSLEGMVKPYYPIIKEKNKKLEEQLKKEYTESLKYLKQNTTFDNFDRVKFYKNHLLPLDTLLLRSHLTLNIETWDEVNYLVKPINYQAKGIFDEKFLNPYYYFQLPQKRNTKEVIELGKLLFFDPILSASNERSCASCHQPQKAFTDGKAKSIATDFKGTVLRNSPTLLNSVYADKYFYDLRTDVLEDQIEHVVVNEKEFHSDYIQLGYKLSMSKAYKTLFEKAFPEVKENNISKYTISSALAAYVASLKSLNSPFDKYLRGEQKSISSEVIRGFNLFAGKAGCATCHFSPIFNGTTPPLYRESESEILGVPKSKDASVLDEDLGRANAKLKEQSSIFLNSFKTPTVRNIALTAPYMHNGVYETLNEVMDFYNKGGGAGLGIIHPNQTLPSEKLNLNEKEINSIIAFMKSLTDTSVVNSTALPKKLPHFEDKPDWNERIIGGKY